MKSFFWTNHGVIILNYYNSIDKLRENQPDIFFCIFHNSSRAPLEIISNVSYLITNYFYVTHSVNQSKLQLKKLTVYTYVYPNVYIVHIDLSKKVINKMVALMKGYNDESQTCKSYDEAVTSMSSVAAAPPCARCLLCKAAVFDCGSRNWHFSIT